MYLLELNGSSLFQTRVYDVSSNHAVDVNYLQFQATAFIFKQLNERDRI